MFSVVPAERKAPISDPIIHAIILSRLKSNSAPSKGLWMRHSASEGSGSSVA